MKYRTGAFCRIEEFQDGKQTLNGKFFKYSFEKPLDKDFSEKIFQELVIISENIHKAQQALELFISGLSVIKGYTEFTFSTIPLVNPINSKLNNSNLNNISFSTDGIFKAAELASKASFRKSKYISIYKFFTACNLHCNYEIDLDPFHTEYFPLSKNPFDYIRYAQSITIFYSIIEELQLEIRASNKNPSKINGEWNTIIKEDLEKRLQQKNVNIKNKVVWNLRSKPTKVHVKEKLILAGKANWSKYSVRDSKIEIIDAISYLSWVRSKVSAHKLGDIANSISIYDVSNANILTRRLILESMKMFYH